MTVEAEQLYTIHCDQINGGDALCKGRKMTLKQARRQAVIFETHDYVIYTYYLKRAEA